MTRFSKDVNTVDNLGSNMRESIRHSMNVILNILVICVTTPQVIVVLPFMVIAFYIIQVILILVKKDLNKFKEVCSISVKPILFSLSYFVYLFMCFLRNSKQTQAWKERDRILRYLTKNKLLSSRGIYITAILKPAVNVTCKAISEIACSWRAVVVDSGPFLKACLSCFKIPSNTSFIQFE